MTSEVESTPSNGHSRERVNFSKIHTAIPIPNLIEVQKRSYERFLQIYTAPADREDTGLQAVFKSIFPISDFRQTCSLEFVEYTIGNWECKCGKLEGLEHLRITCVKCGKKTISQNPKAPRHTCPDCGWANENRVDHCEMCGDPVSLKFKYDVAECQERGMHFTVPLKVKIRLVVYEKDSESVNKEIRDIKEQEVYFGEIPLLTENGTFIINGTERVIVSQLHRSPGVFFQADDQKKVWMAKVIPYRGSWLEFEYDEKDLLYVRIDRKRKFLGSVVLRALGMKADEEVLRRFYRAEPIVVEGKKFFWRVSPGLVGHRARADVSDKKGKETIVSKGKKISAAHVAALEKAGVDAVPIDPEELEGGYAVADIVDTRTGEILAEANEKVGGKAIDEIVARGLGSFEVFFSAESEIGMILSDTLRKDPVKSPEEALVEIYRRLRPGDPPTLEGSRTLFNGMFFDTNRYDLSRVGRLKMNTKLGTSFPLDQRVLAVDDFVLVLKYLLGLRKNPAGVDDIDHLGNRRVRAVGELLENQFRIGLVRMERAIKEKMSVYQEMTTAMPHDLINAKPVMAAIQEFFGSSQLSQFMDQTNPLSEITHKRRLSALGPGGLSRERAGFEVRDVHPTHYGRICPIETPEGPNIGLISSLSCYARINEFGFIESADANRALMGSSMQRQAVPLLRARAPYVGTGMEHITARDSGAVAVARRGGTIDYVDSQRIVVRVEGENEDALTTKELGADIYNLTKFKRSNQNTCISQKPIVRVGQKVHKGQVMADGPCTELGELALGRNVLVAFMPWRGYNFEDAILVSERMVKDDYYTSIHIEEFEIEARDTKLGPEEITRDIPNVSESFLKDL